ncbi:hypothetical protein M0P98_07915 [bacterium]|jgi:hypothetical protein|nr:hypothetical protein [bacterium]
MGKLKRKMGLIHRKKVKAAKESLKAMDKGKISYEQLGSRAQKMLAKRLKAGYKLPTKNVAEKKE